MRFKVCKQFGTGREALVAQFAEQADAALFVTEKLRADVSLKLKVIYRLYEFDDLLAEHHSEKVLIPDQQDDTKGSQGKGSSAGFRPTPFNTAPRPGGMPQKWNKDPDKEDEDK